MSTSDLKADFHQLIDRIDDEEQLRDLYNFVLECTKPVVLTPEQVKRIEKSLAQIERGEVIPHATVMEHAKEWLAKKSSRS